MERAAERMEQSAERNESLWILTAASGIWAAHFLLSYVTAAIWCAKFAGPEASLWTARAAIAWYSLAAFAGIAVVAWRGLRRHRLEAELDAELEAELEAETVPHDADSPEGRHRFVGLSTLLLSGLSAVATLYSALAAVFVRSCH